MSDAQCDGDDDDNKTRTITSTTLTASPYVVTDETQVKGLHSYETAGNESLKAKDLDCLLDGLEEVRIHQHLDVIEVCLCWERNNRYSICDKDGKQVLYMYEAAQCYNRQCYGSLRELRLYLTDNEDNRLLQLDRPLRCSSRMCYACCCLQEITVSLPSKGILGVLRERWSCISPIYVLEDDQGYEKFHFLGDSCHCRVCCSINFTVQAPSGEEVATIHKQWGGCKSIIGASNNFSIHYTTGLSGMEKAVILASVFLLDFNYFERHGKCF